MEQKKNHLNKKSGASSEYGILMQELKIPWYRKRLFWTTQERIAYDLVVTAILVVLIYMLFHFVVGIAVVDGNSMYPTLQDGQTVFYTRINKEYQVGDVISVRMPSGKFYVKRIVAVAGDEVDLKDGLLYVNGNAVESEYAFGETYLETGNVEYPLTVEDGKYFILGDNRGNSNDSRAFGPIIKERITGKVQFSAGRVK